MKSLLSSLLLALLLSCATVEEKYPSWYLNPPQNDATYLYGIGEGYNMDTATKMALKNISEKILITISSEASTQKVETTKGYDESANYRVKESTEKITFSDYKVLNSYSAKSNFVVLVSVSRGDLASSQLKDLYSIDEKIELLNINSQNKTEVERLSALLSIKDLIPEVQTKIKILEALDNNFEGNKYLNKYKLYQHEYEVLKSGITFKVEALNNFDAKIANKIKNYLNNENLSVINNTNNIIKISSTVNRENIYNNYFSKAKVNLSLYSEKKLIKSATLEINGASAISHELSDDSSIDNFGKKLEENGLFKILNLE